MDGPKVERIVENLVMNAVRHTRPDVAISVRVWAGGGGAFLAVEDDGPGRVRRPPGRDLRAVPPGADRLAALPGTGIGLSLVAMFTELHGGRAWVEDREGGGASFRVFLPGEPPEDDVVEHKVSRRRRSEPVDAAKAGARLSGMPDRDHNPHRRRLHLPIVVDERPRARLRGSQAAVAEGAHAGGPQLHGAEGPDAGPLDLHTVCEEAMCPNIGECWEEREATFLILGDKCTRRCGFCDVMTAKPDPVDAGRAATGSPTPVREMGLRFVVITGVARDDLPDGGARIWAATDPGRASRPSPDAASRCSRPTSRAASATSRR